MLPHAPKRRRCQRQQTLQCTAAGRAPVDLSSCAGGLPALSCHTAACSGNITGPSAAMLYVTDCTGGTPPQLTRGTMPAAGHSCVWQQQWTASSVSWCGGARTAARHLSTISASDFQWLTLDCPRPRFSFSLSLRSCRDRGSAAPPTPLQRKQEHVAVIQCGCRCAAVASHSSAHSAQGHSRRQACQKDVAGRDTQAFGAYLSRNSDTGSAAVFFLIAAAPGRAAPGAADGAASASSCLCSRITTPLTSRQQLLTGLTGACCVIWAAQWRLAAPTLDSRSASGCA